MKHIHYPVLISPDNKYVKLIHAKNLFPFLSDDIFVSDDFDVFFFSPQNRVLYKLKTDFKFDHTILNLNSSKIALPIKTIVDAFKDSISHDNLFLTGDMKEFSNSVDFFNKLVTDKNKRLN